MSRCLDKIGDTRAAVECLKDIPAEHRSVDVNLRLGRMLRDIGRDESAIAVFSAVWQKSPFALEAARALIDLGKSAEDLLKSASEAHTSCAPWIPTLIQAYSYERHYAPRDAIRCLESLGSAFDTSLECLLQKARLRLHLIDLSGAIQLYERAHRLDDANVNDMDLYAMCLFERRDPADAARLNSLAQQLTTAGGTERPEPWIAAGLHALMRSDGRAEALADQAIRAGPRHANAYFVKGMVLIANDNTAASLKCFRKAMKLSPSIRTYTGMVHAYIADGQSVMALGTAKEVQKKMPKEAQPLVLLGTAYSAQFDVNDGGRVLRLTREMKKAKIAFQKAIKLDPACEVATHKLVDMNFACQEYQEAVEELKNALKHNESAQLHARLGCALSELSQHGVMHYHEAAEHFQHALALDPGNGDALRGQAKLEMLMKGEDPAKSMGQDGEEEDF